MLVRRLAVAAVLLLVPVAAACGSGGGGKPSTSQLSSKIRESDSAVTEDQADCMAEAMRDILPADALREFMDADVDAESADDEVFEQLSDEQESRLMGAMFGCIDFGDLGGDEDFDFDMDDFDTEGGDPGDNPFGG